MIVIPMAGLSSRFFKAGYTQPKYMLTAFGKPLFDHAVESFKNYFSTERFIFIVRKGFGTPEFVQSRCHALDIVDFEVIVIDKETRGQAETVAIGLKGIDTSAPITIFNIDTFRPNYTFPKELTNTQSYLEVFIGEGDNWSFAKPMNDSSNLVSETAEKRPISNLCSTGLYHFGSKHLFDSAYDKYLKKPLQEWDKGELYIAPIYNELINEGIDVFYNTIDRDDVIFCGIPQEYDDFLKSSNK